MQLLASGKTHAGHRTSNEDCFGIELELGLFVVADGMGAGGDAASRLTVETLCAHFRENPRGDAVLEFDAAIAMAAARIDECSPRQDMACTVAALSLFGQGATIAHVGDSRVYRLRRRRLERMTRDHSVVSDMELTLGRSIAHRASHPMGTVVTFYDQPDFKGAQMVINALQSEIRLASFFKLRFGEAVSTTDPSVKWREAVRSLKIVKNR